MGKGKEWHFDAYQKIVETDGDVFWICVGSKACNNAGCDEGRYAN